MAGDLVATLVADTKQWSSGLAKAQGDIAGFANSVQSTIAGIASAFGGVLGAKMSIAAAEGDIVATKKLETVLRNTGYAAGVTSEEIAKMAGDLERVTKFEDDATMAAASMLAGFENIHGENFKEVLKLSQDLAAWKDMGLDQAAVLLGKALDVPAEGMEKLSRVGVKLTDEQQGLIKSFTAVGDTAGAQRVMLDAWRDKFGGMAEATVTSSEKIGNALGRISEQIGNILLPYVEMFATAVSSPAFAEWESTLGMIAVGLGAVAAGVGAITLAQTAAMIVQSAYTAVMWGISIAQKAVAIGQALVLSLAGPAGWALLAAGAVAFGLAVWGISEAFEGVEKSANDATGAAGGFADNGEQVFMDLGFMDDDGAEQVFAEGSQSFFSEDADEDFRKKMQNLKNDFDEIAGKSKGEIARRNAIEQGMTPGQAEAIGKKVDENEVARKGAATREEMKRTAEELRKSLMTPEETLEAKIDEFKALRDAGQIDAETFAKAEAKARADFAGLDEKPDGPKGGVGALVKGSAEAASAVFAAMRPKDELQKKQLEAEEQQVAQLDTTNSHLSRMAESGIVIFGGTIPA